MVSHTQTYSLYLPRETGHVLEVVRNLFCCTNGMSDGDNNDRRMDSRPSEQHKAATLLMFKSKMVLHKKMKPDSNSVEINCI